MAIELSRHNKIIPRMEQMVAMLKTYEYEIEINTHIDRYWYVQKMAEIDELQCQIDQAAQRLHELRVLLHNESHNVYNKLKADNRIVKKHVCKCNPLAVNR